MKVRWTEGSIRFRITPSELETMRLGRPIGVALRVLDQSWTATIIPGSLTTSISLRGGDFTVSLSASDLHRLMAPDAEGVYFSAGTEPRLRYFIEKDFPCIHPRPEEALELDAETFAAPAGFADKHQRTASACAS
ncbi:MAG: hypothetical protein ABIY70_19260 [Capsulimonas sp.]|uniref:DUF7009 family protein n=1 Tax=Capsulimonas sp. TaxID=2494211 RepID=UPI0032671804